jgi:aspartate beta-hydroxylase
MEKQSAGAIAISELVQDAQRSMQAGRLEEAAGLWQSVLARDADHPKALLHLGQHALYRQNVPLAQSLLERAAGADPQNPVAPLNLSFVFRAAGDAAKELAALTRALTIDPYFLPGLLAKAAFYDRIGKHRQAAKVYSDALTIAPAEPAPWLAEPLEKARAAVAANRAELDRHLEDKLKSARASHGDANLSRFDEAKDVMIGVKKIYTQQPTMLHYPGLPANAFYDNRDFPWLPQVEHATAAIRDELGVLLREQREGFAPYVKHADGAPLNQWAELNHSPKWSAYFIWDDGRRIDEHCAQCPRTAALLQTLPLAEIPGAAPSAFFSAMAPQTRIPPHTGVTNTRLVVHLPLIVPDGCWFRVGNEKRQWQEGKAWIFDDTIEHEAWNGSDLPRIILIFDIWNPHLSRAERELVSGLVNGVQDYYAWEGSPNNADQSSG